MSGWFQGIQTLSTNLRSQASELAQEILGDDVDDDRNSATENEPSSGATVSLLEKKIESLNAEILSLQKANQDLFERATNAEKQIVSPAKFEIESFDFPTTSQGSSVETPKINEFELKKLKDEIKELKAECSHWKSLVKCKEDDSNKEKVRFEYENERLKYEVQHLRLQLEESLKVNQNPSNSGNDNDWDNWNAESTADDRRLDVNDNAINVDLTQKNQALTLECENLRRESEILSSNLLSKDQELEKRREELLEMSKAYEELNRDLEQEKSNNGQTSEVNRQLAAKLDSLRGDIIEYEERYELCKRENEKAVSQLETLSSSFERFKNDLIDSRRAEEASTEECKERLDHVTNELALSLEKRDKLIEDVGKFENVVENFRLQLSEFRTENQNLKRENEILRRAVEEAGDVKQILEETDQQLTEINKSARENELAKLKLELELRQEIDRLTEENANLTKSLDLLRRPTTQADDIKSLNTGNPASCSSGEEDFDENSKVTIKEKKGSGSGSPYMQVDVVKKQDSQCQTSVNRNDASINTEKNGIEDLEQKNEELNSKIQSLLAENDNNEQYLEEKDKEIHHLSQMVVKMGQDFEKELQESELKWRQNSENLNLDVSSLRNEREKLSRDLELSESKNLDLRVKLDALEAKNLEFKLKLDENMEKNAEIAELRLELEQLKIINLDCCSKIQMLESSTSDNENYHNEYASEMSKRQELEARLENLNVEYENLRNDYANEISKHKELEELSTECEILRRDNENERSKVVSLQNENSTLNSQYSSLESQIQQLESEKQQLIILVNEKHEESLKFYNEWQQTLKLTKEKSSSPPPEELEKLRMEISTKNEQIMILERNLAANFDRFTIENEKLKQNMNLIVQSKDRATSELYAERQRSDKLVEQVKVHEDSAQKATKELDRLKQHLVHIENSYTQELVKAEERESDLRQKLSNLENQLINQSDFRQDETQKLKDRVVELSQNLEQALDQRDASLTQLSDVQIELEQSQKSVTNLQNVLLQFQKEKDERSSREIERLKKELQQSKTEKISTMEKISTLEAKISRLRDLESKSSDLERLMSEKDLLLGEMKHEVSRFEQQAASLRDKVLDLEKVRDGKIDKEVLKNVVLGYFYAPNDKKDQVALLLGSILNFTPEEISRCCSTSASGGGWRNFSSTPPGKNAGEQKSLMTQFVKFLENESAPTTTTTTPVTSAAAVLSGGSRKNSRASTPSTVGLTVELPTFQTDHKDTSSADFLKSVLQ